MTRPPPWACLWLLGLLPIDGKVGASEVYAVQPAALPTGMLQALLRRDPLAMRRLHLGFVVDAEHGQPIPGDPGQTAPPAPALSGVSMASGPLSVVHGQLAPVADMGANSPIRWRILRLDSCSEVQGVLAASIIAAFAAPSGYPVAGPIPGPWTATAAMLTAASATAPLIVYALQGDAALALSLPDGFLFPDQASASAFAWTSPTWHQPAALVSGELRLGGSRIALSGALSRLPLATIPGAWVQLRNAACGAYRYIRQSDITVTSGPDDPFQYDGGFIPGGTFATLPGADDRIALTFPQAGAEVQGTAPLVLAIPATSLPQPFAALAIASELPSPAPSGPPVITSGSDGGPLPELDAQGHALSSNVAWFAPGPATTDSSTLQAAVLAVAAGSAGYGTGANNPSMPAIQTPSSGPGTTGLNQIDASRAVQQWCLQQAVPTVGTATVTMPLSPSPIPLQQDASAPPAAAPPPALDGASILVGQDAQLDQDAALPAPPASPVPYARPAQQPGIDVVTATSAVDAAVAPHFDDDHWLGRQIVQQRKSAVLPMDFVDQAMVSRYGARTGVLVPDKEGDPVPGDGANPRTPLPIGCTAGHPFYDLDGDGSLDRFYSDDPFPGGYQALIVSWAYVGGVQQLGDFPLHPPINLQIQGLGRPRSDGHGGWTCIPDLLLRIGQNLSIFDHESLAWNGFRTWYSSGLISFLDPIAPGDPTRYRLAIRTADGAFSAPPSGVADGADPSLLIPLEQVASLPMPVPAPDGLAAPAGATLEAICDWYTGLAAAAQAEPGWQWSWLPAATLPPGVSDRPGVPAVVTLVSRDPAGNECGRLTLHRPWIASPAGPQAFDPSLIPSAPLVVPTSASALPGAGWMWDYPRALPSSAGGSSPADPAAWQFPWIVPWNGDIHSRWHSAQSFTLDQADASLWPDTLGQTCLLSSAVLAQAGSPSVLEWLVHENPQSDPAPGQDPQQWRDGFLASGSAPAAGGQWFASGRAPFHWFGWDARSDVWDRSRRPGGCRMASGRRIYAVDGGQAMYRFNGQLIFAATAAEQLRDLTRMWNYAFTGSEDPRPLQTCLPSLYIPQRIDNRDPASPPLSTASISIAQEAAPQDPIRMAADGHGNSTLAGPIVSDLDSGTSQAGMRWALHRRSIMAAGPVFLFSAARGREWELDMALRMPRSTKLECLEYDHLDSLRATFEAAGRAVEYPGSRTAAISDGFGTLQVVQDSDEIRMLADLARTWFDPAMSISLRDGAMGDPDDRPAGPYPCQPPDLPGGSLASVPGTTTGANTRMAAGQGDLTLSAAGVPIASAVLAYALRCRPEFPLAQTAPDPGQAPGHAIAIEFRHPMLLWYDDAGSVLRVYYGRNCDPDDVFAPATGDQR